MLLDETPAVLSLAGSAVKKHLIRNGKRTDCNISNYVPFLWFLVYQRVLLHLHIHLLLHHLYHRMPYLMSAHTRIIPQPEEVEARMRSFGETRNINPAETENTNENEGHEEVQGNLLHELPDWLQDFREHLVDERNPLEPRGKTLSLWIKTLPILFMNYQWSREQKWNWVRVIIVSTRTFRRTQIVKNV